MNTIERSELQSRVNSLEYNRQEMNYWRARYNEWRKNLTHANKVKSSELKAGAMSGLNRARRELKTYMGAVEIQLGMI